MDSYFGTEKGNRTPD